MYESPVNVIMGEMQTQIEGDIFKAVQSVGIDINKEELIKALQYDREQYEKGYKEGYAKAIDELKKRFRADFEEMMANNMEDCVNWADWLDVTAEELKGGAE